MPVKDKLASVFVEMHHPRTKMTEILKGADPSIILVNSMTSLVDSSALAGGDGLAAADGSEQPAILPVALYCQLSSFLCYFPDDDVSFESRCNPRFRIA